MRQINGLCTYCPYACSTVKNKKVGTDQEMAHSEGNSNSN